MITCDTTTGTVYNDFDEFKERQPQLAAELLETFGKGEWQDNALYVYDDVEDFADYELTEGWYANSFSNQDYNGAPDPLDFIDLRALGAELVSTWDESCHYQANGGKIVTTDYDW